MQTKKENKCVFKIVTASVCGFFKRLIFCVDFVGRDSLGNISDLVVCVCVFLFFHRKHTTGGKG